MAHYTRLELDATSRPRIRVNAIAAGSIATSALEIVMTTPELKQMMEDMTLLARIGDVEDIAAGVVYLASPAGGYRHGQGPRDRRRHRRRHPRLPAPRPLVGFVAVSASATMSRGPEGQSK